MNDITISLAVTNLNDYNNGYLNFKWLELPTTEEEIKEIYDEISNEHEDEVFISDIERDFEYIKNSAEYMTYNDVITLNDFLNEFDENPDMLKALIEYQGDDILELLDNDYIDLSNIIFYPEVTTNKEYARHYLENFKVDLDSIEIYINLEELGEDIARDLEYDEDFIEDYYKFGKEYLEDIGTENILSFTSYIDLDSMGSDFAMDGYISDYGYIELL